MPIEAVGAQLSAAITPALTLPATGTLQAMSGSDFGQLLGNSLSQLDASVHSADVQLRAMAAGQDIPVHDVMISMEQARMQLMFMVEVRNRAVEAYQELMRMQL